MFRCPAASTIRFTSLSILFQFLFSYLASAFRISRGHDAVVFSITTPVHDMTPTVLSTRLVIAEETYDGNDPGGVLGLPLI